MQDEIEFPAAPQRSALDALKKHLIAREEEDEAGFEVEEQGGVLNVVFEEPAVKFVITPNTPVRQIWISALATSFKLDWDASSAGSSFPAPAKNSSRSSIVLSTKTRRTSHRCSGTPVADPPALFRPRIRLRAHLGLQLIHPA